MVSDYSQAGQERWLADHGIDLLRGTGRLADTGVVEVDGARHTAEHVVVATGADPIVPPIPGAASAGGDLGQPRSDEHEGGFLTLLSDEAVSQTVQSQVHQSVVGHRHASVPIGFRLMGQQPQFGRNFVDFSHYLGAVDFRMFAKQPPTAKG